MTEVDGDDPTQVETESASPHASPQVPSHAPLQGVRVVDLSRHLPGPLVTRILADLGARVLKVEEPTAGDPTRIAPPTVKRDPVKRDPVGRDAQEVGSLAALLIAGHASVGLDLKQSIGVEALHALFAEADVVVESFRPGTLARFGLAPLDLRARYPRLILCSISGYGQTGPQSRRAGHDLTYQALAGSLAAHPSAPAVQVADVAGAWSGATAICAALHRRHQSGDGCWIDQSLSDAASHASVTAWAAEADGPQPVGQSLPLTGALACYDVYSTQDGGQFALAMLEPKFWRTFCAAIDRRAWSLRQYSSSPSFRDDVAALIASRSRDEWTALCAEHDLPGEPVLSVAESRDRARHEGREVVHDAQDGVGTRLTYPARFDGDVRAPAEAVPALGADTASVLAAHGISLPEPPKPGLRNRIGSKARRWIGRIVSRRPRN